MKITAPKDFWSGIMFLAFAVVAVATARGYAMGSGGKMGPGYFPLLLGLLLGGLGLVLVARSAVVSGAPVTRLQFRPILTIVAAVVAFGALIDTAGLVVALLLVVALAALASHESRPIETAALAFGMAICCAGVFVYGLQLPLPLWPSF